MLERTHSWFALVPRTVEQERCTQPARNHMEDVMHRFYCVAIPGWLRLTVLMILFSAVAAGYVYADPWPPAAYAGEPADAQVQPAPAQSTPTPTSPLVALTPSPAVPPRPSPVTTTTSSSSSPATDAIASIAATVGQIAHDPTMAVETKTQQITALAAQFNQLVAQWQQQQAALGLIAPPAVTPQPSTTTCVAPCTGTPAPGVAPAEVGAVATPTPASGTGATGTADQLRAQIAAVSQQMNQVSQDTGLTNDARVQQLTTLSAQFNQLMTQLQQTGP